MGEVHKNPCIRRENGNEIISLAAPTLPPPPPTSVPDAKLFESEGGSGLAAAAARWLFELAANSSSKVVSRYRDLLLAHSFGQS